MELTYRFAKSLLKPWLRTWFNWSIEGVENIPREGPAILAFNHIAYLDPLAAAFVVDKAKRIPRFLGKAELFDDWKIGWVLKGAKQIRVDRGTKGAPMALDHAFAAVKKGEVVVIFPEGTITHHPDLSPMEAKSGTARIALATNTPIIPAAIWGTANVWGKGYRKNWKPGQDIAVRVGDPIEVSGDPNSPEAWTAVGDKVMDEISVLVASLRSVVPDRRRKKDAA
ncbi:MAG: 1-acyl-sn-glycerol-3-phosphate acyltransferase [Actinomycetota bacterium]|nr:1-acyl-sn-glycerol-3-phosphate acyltransferase [Actinomycetota bacterium]